MIQTFPQIAGEVELGDKRVVLWHCPLILSIDQNRFTKVLKSMSNDTEDLLPVVTAATTSSSNGGIDDKKMRL